MDDKNFMLTCSLIDGVCKIPDIEPEVISSIQRDWDDILALESCEGTKEIVLEKMKEILFKVALLGGAKKE